jgi:hypothetical protein
MEWWLPKELRIQKEVGSGETLVKEYKVSVKVY